MKHSSTSTWMGTRRQGNEAFLEMRTQKEPKDFRELSSVMMVQQLSSSSRCRQRRRSRDKDFMQCADDVIEVKVLEGPCWMEASRSMWNMQQHP